MTDRPTSEAVTYFPKWDCSALLPLTSFPGIRGGDQPPPPSFNPTQPLHRQSLQTQTAKQRLRASRKDGRTTDMQQTWGHSFIHCSGTFPPESCKHELWIVCSPTRAALEATWAPTCTEKLFKKQEREEHKIWFFPEPSPHPLPSRNSPDLKQ